MLSIIDLLAGIKTTLQSVAEISRVQGIADLTEGIPHGDTPLVQIYPESWQGTQASSGKRTFGGMTQRAIVVHVDIYAKQRANIAEDMAMVVTVADAINEKLDAQACVASPFGVDAKGFQWSAQRVQFEYAGTAFSGIRYTITFVVF